MMQPNLRIFDRAIRFVLGIVLLYAAVALFQHPVAKLISALGAVFALAEALLSRCWLARILGARSTSQSITDENLYLLGVLGTQFIIAYEWWSAGWEKVSSPDFVAGIGKTLTTFANGTPFVWYKSFLLGFAADNATAFAYAVEWGQVLIAITLAATAWIYIFVKVRPIRRLCAALAVAALFGGMLMNANFYLAAGWTGPGTHGINVVMFWIQAILFYIWLSELESQT